MNCVCNFSIVCVNWNTKTNFRSDIFWKYKLGFSIVFNLNNPAKSKMKATMCLFVLCLYVTLFVTSAQQENNGCDTHCGQEYSPICAINDKGETKTFPSECVMKSENCLNKSKYIKTPTADGACPWIRTSININHPTKIQTT